MLFGGCKRKRYRKHPVESTGEIMAVENFASLSKPRHDAAVLLRRREHTLDSVVTSILGRTTVLVSQA